MAKHVFLTGPPGIGKTTLIQKATEILKSSSVPIDGFYTEEVREGGRRVGFDVVTLSGRRGVLSRVGSGPAAARCEYRVGQYVVDLTSFEQLALPLLRNYSLLEVLTPSSADRYAFLSQGIPDQFQPPTAQRNPVENLIGSPLPWRTFKPVKVSSWLAFKLKKASSEAEISQRQPPAGHSLPGSLNSQPLFLENSGN
ncbi:cancer-related nucleoside-triphosphatase isoform X1 [Rhineura floridana]|uniref:cancer-related nucleoside-triphosphatase isoform X1 n=1 Tax=Rhineura floridana TaxID=261503 RepID=UPI002AC88BA1|nr:cancer-related nucleoside-triphosphatase isoform X1 [Rhineura floridana]